MFYISKPRWTRSRVLAAAFYFNIFFTIKIVTLPNKQYRFFYHFFKAKGKMSIHFRNKCTVVDDVICQPPCETKWKPTQPRLVMQGFAKDVQIVDNKAYII